MIREMFCISTKFADDGNAADHGTALWEPLDWIIFNVPSKSQIWFHCMWLFPPPQRIEIWKWNGILVSQIHSVNHSRVGRLNIYSAIRPIDFKYSTLGPQFIGKRSKEINIDQELEDIYRSLKECFYILQMRKLRLREDK